jgi:hypothetical protein
MAYQYIFRKYKLKKPGISRYQALINWRAQLEDSKAEDWLVDEFPMQERQKGGWLSQAIKQLRG